MPARRPPPLPPAPSPGPIAGAAAALLADIGVGGVASRTSEDGTGEFGGKSGGGNATGGPPSAPAPPSPAGDDSDLPADTPPPDELDGFWTADDTNDSFQITLEDGEFRAYRGQPWVCRPSGPAPADGAGGSYSQTDDHFHARRQGSDLVGEIEVCWFGGADDPYWAPVPVTLSLNADRDALVGSWHDDVANLDRALRLTRQPAPELTAMDFGMPATNLRIYDYGSKKVQRANGLVVAVPEGYVSDPETDETVVRHTGIDFTSRDDTWVVASLPFSTPVGGTVHVYPYSPRNTVAVLLDTGDQLQFLHATELLVQGGERVAAATVLGKTGATGASRIHLHVQAKNAQGNFLSPDWVVARARQRSDRSLSDIG